MSSSQQQEQLPDTHTITIPNNNDNDNDTDYESSSPSQTAVVHYQLRGLTSDDEVSNWSNFCRECFRDKKPIPPPADYFTRHYYNDPFRDRALVRVMMTLPSTATAPPISPPSPVAQSPTIASTLRIFRRRISTGGTNSSLLPPRRYLTAGGIGEVCTSRPHRRRGLTTRMLRDALCLMDATAEERGTGMECSLLHAAPALVPFYRRAGGYGCVTSKWSVLTVDLGRLFAAAAAAPPSSSVKPGIRIRSARFPGDAKTLQKIYRTYSEDRFVGCILRTEQYWNEYLSQEIGDSLFVLTIPRTSSQKDEDDNDGGGGGGEKEDNTPIIIAWISIRTRDGGKLYQLCDFGADTDLSTKHRLSTAYLMSRLLQVALDAHRSTTVDGNGVSGGGTGRVKLHLPHPIVEELRTPDSRGDDDEWIDWKAGVVEKDDTGWMYRFFTTTDNDNNGDDSGAPSKGSSMAHLIEHHKKYHVIWPSDSF